MIPREGDAKRHGRVSTPYAQAVSPSATQLDGGSVAPTDGRLARDYADAVAELARNPSAVFRVLVQEHFDHAGSGWPENTRAEVRRVEGGYRLTPRHEGFVAVGAPLGAPVRDVVVSATFVKLGGRPGGAFGLVIRDQLPTQRDALNTLGHFYVAEIDDSGEVAILQREHDRWQPLAVSSGPSAVHVAGGRTELTLEAVGPRLTFLVNGSAVASTHDAVLDRGGVGVFVGGLDNDVLVERFVVHSFI